MYINFNIFIQHYGIDALVLRLNINYIFTAIHSIYTLYLIDFSEMDGCGILSKKNINCD